jgi:hypothetical protein
MIELQEDVATRQRAGLPLDLADTAGVPVHAVDVDAVVLASQLREFPECGAVIVGVVEDHPLPFRVPLPQQGSQRRIIRDPVR